MYYLYEKKDIFPEIEGFSTESCPRSDLLGVGSCKFDTYRFNIEKKQNIIFYFANFCLSIFFRPKQKIVFENSLISHDVQESWEMGVHGLGQ